MVLVCQVILQDHVIKGSCDLMAMGPLGKDIILPGLVAIGTVLVVI